MAHAADDELRKGLAEAKKKIKVGQVYSHFKDPTKRYLIEFIGFWEQTDEVCVGYRGLYGGRYLFVRLLSVFLEEVEVHGKNVPRFSLV